MTIRSGLLYPTIIRRPHAYTALDIRWAFVSSAAFSRYHKVCDGWSEA